MPSTARKAAGNAAAKKAAQRMIPPVSFSEKKGNTETEPEKETTDVTTATIEEAITPETPATGDLATEMKPVVDTTGNSEKPADDDNRKKMTTAAIKAFQWDDLNAAEVIDYKRETPPTAHAFDAEKDTPEPIKARAVASYEQYNASDSQKGWMRQKLPNEEMAKAFLAAMKKWAKYRTRTITSPAENEGEEPKVTVLPAPLTVKGRIDPKDSTVVAFRVVPFEQRTRKSGS